MVVLIPFRTRSLRSHSACVSVGAVAYLVVDVR